MTDKIGQVEIGISADTKGFTQDLNKAKGELQRITSQKRSVEIAANIVDLQKKIEKAKEDLRKFKKEGDESGQIKARMDITKFQTDLSKAQKELRNTFKEIKAGEYANLTARLNEARHAYKNLAAAGQENTKQAKTLLQEIGKLDAAVKKIDAAVGQHQRNVGNYRSAISGLKGEFSKLVLQIGTTVASVKALQKALGSAMIYEQIKTQFEVLTGSVENAKDHMTDLNKFALVTPFTIPGIRDASAQLHAYGLETEKVIPTLESLGNIARGNQEIFGRLTYAYGQVKAAQKLYGTELRQFTEAGVPLIEEFAKHFGVAQGEIRKMVEEGKVTFKDLDSVLTKLSSDGGRFAGLMEKQSQTVAGSLSNIKDAWTQSTEKISDTKPYAVLRMALLSLAENMNTILKKVAASIKIVADAASFLLPYLTAIATLGLGKKLSVMALGFVNLKKSIMQAVAASWTFIASPMGAAFTALAAVIGAVTFQFIKSSKAAIEMKLQLDELTRSMAALGKWGTKLAEVQKNTFGDSQKFVTEGTKVLEEWIQKMYEMGATEEELRKVTERIKSITGDDSLLRKTKEIENFTKAVKTELEDMTMTAVRNFGRITEAQKEVNFNDAIAEIQKLTGANKQQMDLIIQDLIEREAIAGDLGKAFGIAFANGMSDEEVISQLEKAGIAVTDDMLEKIGIETNPIARKVGAALGINFSSAFTDGIRTEDAQEKFEKDVEKMAEAAERNFDNIVESLERTQGDIDNIQRQINYRDAVAEIQNLTQANEEQMDLIIKDLVLRAAQANDLGRAFNIALANGMSAPDVVAYLNESGVVVTQGMLDEIGIKVTPIAGQAGAQLGAQLALKFQKNVEPVFAILDKVSPLLGAQARLATGTATKVLDNLQNNLSDVSKQVAIEKKQLDAAIKSAGKASSSAASAADKAEEERQRKMEQLARDFDNEIKKINDDILKNNDDLIDNLNDNQKDHQEELDKTNEAILDLGESYEKMKKDASSEVRDLVHDIEELEKATERAVGALESSFGEKISKRIVDLREEQEKLNEELNKMRSDGIDADEAERFVEIQERIQKISEEISKGEQQVSTEEIAEAKRQAGLSEIERLIEERDTAIAAEKEKAAEEKSQLEERKKILDAFLEGKVSQLGEMQSYENQLLLERYQAEVKSFQDRRAALSFHLEETKQMFLKNDEEIRAAALENAAKLQSDLERLTAGRASLGVTLEKDMTPQEYLRTQGFANGGMVRGPGSSTSDSIPARLSNGEFVMNAMATKAFAPLLAAMNGAQSLQKNQNNGMIQPSPVNNTSNLTVNAPQSSVDPSVMAQMIKFYTE